MIVSAAKAQEAADVLGVELKTLTPDTLRHAYRTKAKECHPDHHGTKQLPLWARVSWAKECLTHWLEHHPEQDTHEIAQGDCRACGGTGRVKVGGGFSTLRMWCVMCNGTGAAVEVSGD